MLDHWIRLNSLCESPTLSYPDDAESRVNPAIMKYLIISALGTDRPGLVNELSKAVFNCGCNVVDSRMTVLGGDFAIMLLVNGKWNELAKLESALPGVAKRLELTLTTKHTEQRGQTKENWVPYGVEVVAIDHPGIVYHLADFFSRRQINIEELNTHTYAAPHTGTPMFAVHLTIGVPGHMHIASLRDEFMEFCDQRNLDAILEPVKGQ
jgi:glycine cleavage system transcriptional repressor